ncbi:MAG: Gfo/Idh/MocA family oxidoreductase [Candidatus Symbiobacter sp.]|nr:Gfo/Idh/MocA family oxidoreductase [Candidatus Symbiobacter sp.]
MTKILKAAVIGAGRMGSHHARILASLPGVELCAVIDQNANKATCLAANYGAAGYDDLNRLIGKIDCAIIAAPSSLHAVIGCQLLAAGISCLIEKPLALTAQDCQALITTAKHHHTNLAVGHVERFNPAFIAAADWLLGKQILAIEARRMNPGSNRILDNDVVSDLMVHDLDAILYLVNRDHPRQMVNLAALGICGGGSRQYDQAMAQMGFADPGGGQPIIANIQASRITQYRVRDLTVLTDQGVVVVDYLAGQAKIFHGQSQAGAGAAAGAGAVTTIRVEPLWVPASDPLTLEISKFIGFLHRHEEKKAGSGIGIGIGIGIGNGIDAAQPIGVTGEEALATLEAVWAITAKMNASTPHH